MNGSLGPRLVNVPRKGIYRAGRWADIYRFPPPPQPLTLTPEPVCDGYRWEDVHGRFSTVKFSRSPEAAVGRTIARYRRREIEGTGLLDLMKGFLTGTPDAGEPELIDNRVPPSYFEDAHLLHLPYDDDLTFVDLEHERTRDILRTEIGAAIRLMGARIDANLTRSRDRRVTRMVITELHRYCRSLDYRHVAGVRYAALDKAWDAYVFWNQPWRTDFSGAGTATPLSPTDPEVRRASRVLGIDLP